MIYISKTDQQNVPIFKKIIKIETPGLCHFKALDERNTTSFSNVKKMGIREFPDDFSCMVNSIYFKLLYKKELPAMGHTKVRTYISSTQLLSSLLYVIFA